MLISSDISMRVLRMMVEEEGFEPSLGINLNTLSRRAPSATQPFLHGVALQQRVIV